MVTASPRGEGEMVLCAHSLSLSCVGGDQPQLTLGCPGSCLINPPSHPVPDVPVHVWPCLVEGQTEVQGGSYSGHVVREG